MQPNDFGFEKVGRTIWIAFFRPNDSINKVKILDFILLSERLYIYLPNIN